jgi:acetyl-CoA carboxylase biotin carboxylase subunit
VEVQILGLADGRVVALSERECSVQRRNQKLLEEAPSPAVSPELRTRFLAAARKAGEAVGYRNAGTVECLLDPSTGEFFFLEMNTRLQVEHPITELLHGIDLVEEQLRIPGRAHQHRARHRAPGQRGGPEAVPARPGRREVLGGADG